MSLYTTDRPEFIERLAKLAGGTTYRTPAAPRGTKQDQLPDAHAIAAALAFARRMEDPDDIGPDVAYCWALGSDAYKARVTRRLAIALRCHETRSVGPHRLAVAETAWEVMIHNRRPTTTAPADCNQRMWDRMLLAAIHVMQTSAWDSLADAERAYRRVA